MVCQSQCFRRQAHNHHRDILNRPHRPKADTEPHVLSNKAEGETFAKVAQKSPRLTVVRSYPFISTRRIFFPLAHCCVEKGETPTADFRIAPKLRICHNNRGVFTSDKSLHSSRSLDESPHTLLFLLSPPNLPMLHK